LLLGYKKINFLLNSGVAMSNVTVYLANPRGFCAGVDRAIDIVEAAIKKYGAPVYVRHEVVHNRFVVDNLRQKGAIFVDQISEVPNGCVLIFSAHGVSQQVRKDAKAKDCKIVLDATCPLVTKVHSEVKRQSQKARECILIGHKGHAEVEGTLGQYSHDSGAIYLVETAEDVVKLKVNNENELYYVTQTTLSVDETKDIIAALKVKFPNIKGPDKDDICYATQNRQDAVKLLARVCQFILVVGSPTSSNSNRLRELAEKRGCKAYLVDDPEQVKPEWFSSGNIGVTAGASAPEVLVQSICNKIKEFFPQAQLKEMQGIEENVKFSMPLAVRDVPISNTFKTRIVTEA
jgi:4-hydroxy-3-methylbut-2-enyl diphosphate reductase